MPSKIACEGMELLFENLNLSINKNDILKDVSGIAIPGDMLAVMGASGSGKTTLLNILAGRLSVDTGSILVNGEKVTKDIKRKICYVLQQDLLFSNLTVRETIGFTAMLRLPDTMTYKEKMKRVDDIVVELGLTKCLDTVIGDAFTRGVSGGEKKRTNIACELLTNPMLMLLDEPTSGLDSSTACSLIKTLKEYTKRSNKTVVTTIHQPSSQIFHMFDRVLLLCEGEIAYFGNAHKILDFFENIGLPCVPNYNPADFILEKVKESEEVQKRIVAGARALRNGDNRYDNMLRQSKSASSSIHSLNANGIDMNTDPVKVPLDAIEMNGNGGISTLDAVHVDIDANKESEVSFIPKDFSIPYSNTKWPTTFFTQYKTLTMRTFKQSRPRILSKLQIIQSLVLSLITGLLWFQLPRTEATLNDRKGVLFFIVIYWCFNPMIDAIQSFPDERAVINKERAAGAYRLSSYYLAKMTSELPIMMLLPTISITMVYWMANLNGVAAFFLTWFTLLSTSLAAQSMGFFIGASANDLKTAITAAAVCMLSFMLAGGYYQKNLPFWFSWVKYASFVYYSYYAQLISEFDTTNGIICSPANVTVFDDCLLPNATHFASPIVLDIEGVEWPIWAFILVLYGFTFAFRTAGYLVLRFLRKPHTV